MGVESHQEKLSFQAEVKELLNIVVHSLYSNKEIFLRELISNASDAADKLRFEALADGALYESDPELKIHISYDKEAHTITVRDNGIGMSREEITQHLGTIAKSGTREFLSQLTGDQKKDAHLIGQFGVGFYSAFIVAEEVTVLSRRAGLEPAHGVKWVSKGDGEYTLETIERLQRGTEIILHLKKDEDEFLNDWRLRSIITKYSDHLNIPIMMPKLAEGDTAAPKDEWEQVNRATALWTLPKKEITANQYNEFYKHIAHDFEDPLTYTQHRIEGSKVDYTCILYVPSHAPFDLWQRDSQQGLKLYVQRVFIMDQVRQFLPDYLRFIRGVIDTNALPLNISREILQDHHVIPKLRSAVTKHVLDLLDQLAKQDPQKYAQFWEHFGSVLKEGPAEDFANRARIAKLLRFSSTHTDSESQTVSLDDYIKRMKPSQKKIYFITADHLNAAKSSPHLEIFRKNDVEVLLLTDRIDEWLINHLPEYEEKPLQSVAKGELELDDLIAETPEEKKEEEKKEKEQQQELGDTLKNIQTVLSDFVKEVRLSHRLISSPACLVRDKDALGPQMERLLKAAGQTVTEAKPILELNPNHAIIQHLQQEKNQEQLKEWSHILFEQALLAEGSHLKDPAVFVDRLNKLWIELFEPK